MPDTVTRESFGPCTWNSRVWMVLPYVASGAS